MADPRFPERERGPDQEETESPEEGTTFGRGRVPITSPCPRIHHMAMTVIRWVPLTTSSVNTSPGCNELIFSLEKKTLTIDINV